MQEDKQENHQEGFRILFADDDGASELVAALYATPFSKELKDALNNELFTGSRFPPGLHGLFNETRISALSTGDFVARCDLGGAGESVLAAFRALASGKSLSD